MKCKKKNDLPFRYNKMGRWFGKTTVRDENAENGLRVAECKFKGTPFSYSEYLDTRAKLAPQKEKTKFCYALFSESGFDERTVQEENVTLYDLAQIVNHK